MNIRERILKYLEYKGITRYKFYQQTGFSNGFLDKEGAIGSDKCEIICYQYPDLSPEWLLTGQGVMIKEETITKIHKPTKYMEKILESQEITLYDIKAAANLKTLFIQKTQNILGVIKLPNIPKCDGALYVTGDSMDPLIKSGDIVCYKEIYDFNSIIYGEMYLVSMDIEGDEYLTIKYITHSEKGENWIRLESYNKRHSPKDYELQFVNALALIKVSIRMSTM